MTDYCVSLRLNIQNGDYLTIDNMIAHHTKTGFSSNGSPPVTVAAVSTSWKLELTFDSTKGFPPTPNTWLKAIQLVWLGS